MNATAGKARIIVVMGVSGAGKSTLGLALAKHLGVPFFDGDDYHPQANVEKMSQGMALNDADRAPWLARLHTLIEGELQRRGAVLACSALKQAYREQLGQGLEDRVSLVHLVGPSQLVAQRLSGRTGHFMRPELLLSQYETLEAPPDAIIVDIRTSTDEQVQRVVQALAP